MKLRTLLIALVAGLCGCSKQAVVDLTIVVDPSVPASVVSAVRSLQFDVSGPFTQSTTVALTHPFQSQGPERIAIRAAAAGDVTLDVSALDDAGAALLAGETALTLQAGATRAQTLTLTLPVAQGPDGGAPPDQAESSPPDLALPPPADLAPAPDMTTIVCPSNVLLCEDFESGAISTAKWEGGIRQTNATTTIDQTRAHRGQYSLHLRTNVVASGSAEADLAETHTFTPPGATFWVRAFYYLPSNTATAVAVLFDAAQNATPYNDVTLSLDHDALSIYNSMNSGSYVASTTPKLPLDQWVCVEWEVYTGSPNQLHAWINGQPVTALDVTQTTNPATPIGLFSVGFAIYPPATSSIALDVWVDDIIFDHAPIGCAK